MEIKAGFTFVDILIVIIIIGLLIGEIFGGVKSLYTMQFRIAFW
jgi:hypothetical protein